MPEPPLRVCVAGATGGTGSAVARGVLASTDLTLVSAVARTAAGSDLGRAWGQEPLGVAVHGTVEEALDGVDVLIDYTSYTAIHGHAVTALDRGVAVVVGSSGLTAEDLASLESRAVEHRTGIFAGGNFSLTATLMSITAQIAAEYLKDWEIVDYARADKPDAPSGTARELAERLATVRPAAPARTDARDDAENGARGLPVANTRVHSLRLPSYELKTEVIFGLADERLTISHESGFQAEKFVAGTLLATRSLRGFVGMRRGLDSILDSRSFEVSR